MNKLVHAISMEATPLCLLLNKPHLFSLTQHRFIVIQFSTCTCVLHVSACTEAILRHGSTIFLQKSYKGLFKIFVLTCLRMASVQAETCSTHVQVPNWIKINLCCVRRNKCSLFLHATNVVATKYKVHIFFFLLRVIIPAPPIYRKHSYKTANFK